ncbi:MAG: cyanophycin metabolism-associated DUF1854 family protein [Burkholderiales bacterium]
MPEFELARNAFGRLVLKNDAGVHEGVVPVRAFPVTAPGEGIALMSAQGRELAWIASMESLPDEARVLLEEALRDREFMPEILSLVSVSGYAAPCEWRVETDRGDTAFTLKSEDDIRRISPSALILTDSHGVNFLIKNPADLDRHSKKLLGRFL